MWQKTESAKKDQNKDPHKSTQPQHTGRSEATQSYKSLKSDREHTKPARSNTHKELLETLSQSIAFVQEPQETSSDWMNKLKEDSAQFLAEQRGVQLRQIYQESRYKQGIESLMDKIYGLMQRYSFEFNHVACGTDLHVSNTISGDVTEVTRYNRFREVEETRTYFRARFSTRLLSLVLRGKDDTVEFYIIPTNKVIALSKYENEYRPVAILEIRFTEQGMMWRMKDGTPKVDSLDELSMWLFVNLIQDTKQAATKETQATG